MYDFYNNKFIGFINIAELLLQEQLRKRKEEDERLAAQQDFLNRSLRGSRKLQALESRPHGVVNDAFADEPEVESTASTEKSAVDREVVYTAYGTFMLF